jgi:vacuolar-type H+-ATPase subunit I/STV1
VANLPEVDQKLYPYFNIVQNDSTKKKIRKILRRFNFAVWHFDATTKKLLQSKNEEAREQDTDTDDDAPSLDDDVSSENSSDSSVSIVDVSTDQDSQVADVQSNHEEESEQDAETTPS